MRHAYGMGVEAVPHRFEAEIDRDWWVGEAPLARKPISRGEFMKAVRSSGEYFEHDRGEMIGFLLDWDEDE